MLHEQYQESPISPRDPCDGLYQFKCCPIVVRLTQTDCASTWEALSATATFYSATCIFCSCIVAVRLTIAQWACDAPCHTHAMFK